METLPNINLTEEIAKHYIKDKYISMGSEGIVFKYNKKSVIKIFGFWDQDIMIDGMTSEKLEKINLLYHKNITEMVKILGTVSLNNHIIGYQMSYSKNDISYFDASYPIGVNIYLLKSIKEALLSFHKNNIIYGDIFSGNILIDKNTNHIKFCDIDNVMVDNLPFDFLGSVLFKYIDAHGCIDETIDAFAFNILAILKTLFPNDKKVNRIDILNLLRNNFDLVTDEFCKQQFLQDNSKKIKRIAKSMLNPKEYQGEYIL